MSNQLKADLMILLVTLGWGGSYYAIDICLEDMGPFTLNAFRFVGAFLVVVLFSFKRLKKINQKTLQYAVLAGSMMATAYMMATFAIMHTTMSNAAFLASMTVLFTPLLAFFFKGQRPSRKFKFVVLLCVIGMALLTLNEALRPALGDVFSILCALTFSVNLLVVETAVSKSSGEGQKEEREPVDAYTLGVCLLGVVGGVMLALAFVFESPHLPSAPVYWGYALFLSLFCTGMAVIAQALAQQHTTASHVGLIYTLEPIFAAAVAFVMAGEVLKPRGYLGAALMILSVLVMEIDFGKKIGKGTKPPSPCP